MSTQTEELATTPKPAKAMVIADERGLKFGNLEEMWRFAVAVVASRQFKDVETPEIALIRMQAGMELGLSPIWSLTNIFVIGGRPAVWGDGLLGLVLNHPKCEDVIETFTGTFPNDDFTAVCEVWRKGRLPVIRTFSVADAKKAGIFGKNVHASYPKRMLQMRARSWACRDGFADALRGLGVIEELRDVQEPAKARVVEAKLHFADEPAVEIEATPVAEHAAETPASEAEKRDADGTFVF